MEGSDLKSTTTLLNRYYTIQTLLGLSNGILCIFVAQWAAKMPKFKIGGLKNDKNMAKHTIETRNRGLTPVFFGPQILPPAVLKPLEPHRCTVFHLKIPKIFEWCSI